MPWGLFDAATGAHGATGVILTVKRGSGRPFGSDKKGAFRSLPTAYTVSSWARGGVSAAATFHLLHLATCAKCADHLDELVVVEAEQAEKAANPIQHLVATIRHGPNS